MPQTLHYTISEVTPYISWTYFFHAWGFPARFAAIAHIHGCDSCRATWLASFPEADRVQAAAAMQLCKEAQRMLAVLAAQGFRTHVRFDILPCNSDGEDIVIFPPPAAHTPPRESAATREGSLCRLAFLRQQVAPFLCLADFIRPVNADGKRDQMGIFIACTDEAVEHLYDDAAPTADAYRHMLCQTLADRLAEAATERAHQAVRKHYWGYAPDEQLCMADLHAGHYRGIRPAVGYPCMPDQSLNFDLDSLLDFSSIGVRLTENGAMQPHAAVSGLMLAHDKARYFAVGHITPDQLNDYAQRKGRTPEEMRHYLAANI